MKKKSEAIAFTWVKGLFLKTVSDKYTILKVCYEQYIHKMHILFSEISLNKKHTTVLFKLSCCKF